MSTKSQDELDEERYLSELEEEKELLRALRSPESLPEPEKLPPEYADAMEWLKEENAKRKN